VDTLTDAEAPGDRLFQPVSWKLRLGVALLAAAAMAGAVAMARFHMWVTSRSAPTVAAPDILESLTDRRLVRITITTSSWKTVPKVVPLNQLGWDREVWRQMHFGDWDRLPSDVRERPLQRMAHVYDPLLRQPAAWRRMTAGDWDQVPQPIRAIAFLRMAHHWAVSRRVGGEFGLDPVRMGQTIGGIIMAESWFDHRAEHVNPYGNRDVGLAQCSNHCRRILAEMAKSGAIPFAPDEEDYFNPWIATWVATVWFERELGRAEGDVELAIRAYHRGLDAAMDERGTAYLANVLRLRERYVRTQRTSASWRSLVRLISSKAQRDPAASTSSPAHVGQLRQSEPTASPGRPSR
jgi:hypothetical protein